MPDASAASALGRVVLGTTAYADELLRLGDRYPKATVTEEMFDGSDILRVEPDLLVAELLKDGKEVVIEVIPNTLAVFIGTPLSALSPLDTLQSFADRTDHLLSGLLNHPVELEYRILNSK